MKVERDFKLVCTGGPYGDCCCSYAVELRGEWTVQEFVKAVLERNPCEWGFFYIQRAGQKWYEAQVKIEYGQAALGGHDGLRLCLGVNAVCDCLIDDDFVVSHGENLQNIFY